MVVVADKELRTPKYLFALSLGRPVVTFTHLDACVAAKVPRQTFSVSHDTDSHLRNFMVNAAMYNR